MKGKRIMIEDTNIERPEIFAPPNHAARVEQATKLTAQTIRNACDAAGETVLALVTEAEQNLACVRVDAEKFVATFKDIGGQYADRIEVALSTVTDTMIAIKKQHDLVTKMLDIKHVDEEAKKRGIKAVEDAVEQVKAAQ